MVWAHFLFRCPTMISNFQQHSDFGVRWAVAMKRLNRRFIFAFNIPPESEHERFSDDYSTNVMVRIIDMWYDGIKKRHFEKGGFLRQMLVISTTSAKGRNGVL